MSNGGHISQPQEPAEAPAPACPNGQASEKRIVRTAAALDRNRVFVTVFWFSMQFEETAHDQTCVGSRCPARYGAPEFSGRTSGHAGARLLRVLLPERQLPE
jgi:hypothetical protein